MSRLQTELKQRRPFESAEQEAFLNLLRTTSALLRHETELLKRFDLTPSQFNVLRILRGAGAEGLIGREIGERMLTYDPDVTKLLDRLEARELVRRARHPEDRRAIVARITPAGLRLLERIDGPMLELVDGLLHHLGPARLATLTRLLEAAREKA